MLVNLYQATYNAIPNDGNIRDHAAMYVNILVNLLNKDVFKYNWKSRDKCKIFLPIRYWKKKFWKGISTLRSSKYYIAVQPGHYSSLTAPNLQPTANQERNDPCGNQHYSRELLMMGIVVPETCWAYKKYNKIIIGI